MNYFERFQRAGESAGVFIPLRVEAGIFKNPQPVADQNAPKGRISHDSGLKAVLTHPEPETALCKNRGAIAKAPTSPVFAISPIF